MWLALCRDRAACCQFSLFICTDAKSAPSKGLSEPLICGRSINSFLSASLQEKRACLLPR
jgi:hypothetical protein